MFKKPGFAFFFVVAVVTSHIKTNCTEFKQTNTFTGHRDTNPFLLDKCGLAHVGRARACLFGGLQHRAAPSCTIPLGNVADNGKRWEVPGRESARSGVVCGSCAGQAPG